MNIQQRLTILFAFLVSLVVIPSNIISWQIVSQKFYELTTIEARDKAQEFQELIHVLELLKLPNKPMRRKQFFTRLIQNIQDDNYIQLQTFDGQLIAQSTNFQEQNFLVINCQHEETGYLSVASINVSYYCHHLQKDQEFLGRLLVMIPLQKTESILNKLLVQEVIQTMIIILFSLILGSFWSKKALEPIRQITREVSESVKGNIFKLIKTSHLAKDEIRVLAESFNTLLQKIGALFFSQKRFLSNASHELKSPLTAILGHAQLARKRGKEHPQILDDSIGSIIRETQRLQRLVNELLELSTLEKTPIKLSTVNFIPILYEVLKDDIKPLQNEVEIRVEVEKDSVFEIDGHPDSIKQVLINLFSNALRVVDPKSGQINISCKKNTQFLEVSIQDNGPGIPADAIPHLFERFYRVDIARSRQQGGSGLGLSIVKEIMDQHHGHIQVESTLQEGTVIRLKFPLK